MRLLLTLALAVSVSPAFGQMLLKQSTARTIPFGPFLDDTDGKTAETGLTLSQADIRLSKNGGSFAQTNNATGASHMENGVYGVPLDTTDTGTLGHLRVEIHESGALPVWQDFVVVPANTYDTLVAGTDALNADMDEIAGSAVSTSTAQLGVNVVNFGGSAGTFASGIPAVNATQFSGSATAADNAEIVFSTDFATNYDTTNDMWNVDVEKVGGTIASTALLDSNDIDTILRNSQPTNANGGKVWFVDASASGAGTGYNPTDAFTTVTAGEAAMSDGDTLIIAAGQYVEQVTFDKNNTFIIGAGGTNTEIQVASGASSGNYQALRIRGNNVTAIGIYANSQKVSTSGAGIDFDSTTGTTIDRCVSYGTADGVYGTSSKNAKLLNSRFTSSYDGGNMIDAQQFYAENCIFETDGSWTTSNQNTRGLIATANATTLTDGLTSGKLVNCDFISRKSQTTTNGKDVVGLAVSGPGVEVEGCRVTCECDQAGFTGEVFGIVAGYHNLTETITYPGVVHVKGTTIDLTNAGGVTPYGLKTFNAASHLHYTDVRFTGIDVSDGGSIVEDTLKPTSAGRTLDVSSGGEAGIDLANIGSPTTTVNLSGTTISTSQAVASVTSGVSLADDSITAAKIAANAIGASEIADDAIGAAEIASSAITSAEAPNLDAAISTRATASSIAALNDISAVEVENAVFDATMADHLDAGSTGASLNGAASAGDPWGTALPGAYGSGSAGKIIADALSTHTPQSGDAYSRLGAPAGASIAADIAGIESGSGGLDAAGVRAAIGMASANLDTQLDALPTAAEINTAVENGQVGSDAADAVTAAQEAKAAAEAVEGAVAPAVTADRVPKQLTFNLGSEGYQSRNIVKLNAWSTGTRTLGFDFSELLKQSDTTILSVSSVTVVKGATSITTSDLRKHQNGMTALWDTAAINSANAGTYVVTVTIQTVDSNTIVVTGTLEVE